MEGLCAFSALLCTLSIVKAPGLLFRPNCGLFGMVAAQLDTSSSEKNLFFRGSCEMNIVVKKNNTTRTIPDPDQWRQDRTQVDLN